MILGIATSETTNQSSPIAAITRLVDLVCNIDKPSQRLQHQHPHLTSPLRPLWSLTIATSSCHMLLSAVTIAATFTVVCRLNSASSVLMRPDDYNDVTVFLRCKAWSHQSHQLTLLVRANNTMDKTPTIVAYR